MTISNFAFLWTTGTALALLVLRSIWLPHTRALVRTVVFLVSLSLIFDVAATARAVWTFPDVIGLYLISTPLESPLMIGLLTINLLLIHLSVKQHFGDYNQRL